jgi:hypothetical protein
LTVKNHDAGDVTVMVTLRVAVGVVMMFTMNLMRIMFKMTMAVTTTQTDWWI